MKRTVAATLLALALAAQAHAETKNSVPPVATAKVPAGDYTLDLSHASLIFKLNHLGFSNYTARFKRMDAKLQFDPAQLAASKLTATVDARSLETDFPDPAKIDFNAELQNEKWLDTAKFPAITFRSTSIEQTGPKAMLVKGDLTLHGVTRPIALKATYNGGYAGHPMDPHARIGFSAQGTLKRSDFGVSYGIPAPGTTMGVGDEVTVILETEFSGPPLAAAK